MFWCYLSPHLGPTGGDDGDGGSDAEAAAEPQEEGDHTTCMFFFDSFSCLPAVLVVDVISANCSRLCSSV